MIASCERMNLRRTGEEHPNAKLTAAQVREIRRLRAEGASHAWLGERFGVSRTAVSNLLRGYTWADTP